MTTFLIRILPLSLCVLLSLSIRAASCNCDLTISKSGTYNAQQYPVKPGQTICVQAGNYSQLRFVDLQGTARAPIRIINCGGRVTVGDPSASGGIQFYNCQYFKLTGTGDSQALYGFLINQSGDGAGLTITNKSSDSEIERVEIMNMSFAGIMAKTDPSCDPSTWRGNFTMYNVNLHHNYIHDTQGEGIYVGNSFWSAGVSKACDNSTDVVFPHEIIGLHIHHNFIERSGAEGIQYGCAPGADVHHNIVRNPGGNPFAQFQNNGVQIGEGSSGRFYGNKITNAASAGLIIIGHNGKLAVFNNLIVNARSNGIFCDNRAGSTAGTTAHFLNNTIVTTGREGIKLFNENNVNTVANNVLVNIWEGQYVTFGQGATATLRANYQTASIAAARFVDALTYNFQLTATSPAVNLGVNLASWGVTDDLQGTARPDSGPYDAGAYEYAASGARVGLVDESDAPNPPDHLRVFPSPCQDELTIQLPSDALIRRVQIYDLNGYLVSGHLCHAAPSSSTTEDLTALPTGLYLLRVEDSSERQYSTRFVKK